MYVPLGLHETVYIYMYVSIQSAAVYINETNSTYITHYDGNIDGYVCGSVRIAHFCITLYVLIYVHYVLHELEKVFMLSQV